MNNVPIIHGKSFSEKSKSAANIITVLHTYDCADTFVEYGTSTTCNVVTRGADVLLYDLSQVHSDFISKRLRYYHLFCIEISINELLVSSLSIFDGNLIDEFKMVKDKFKIPTYTSGRFSFDSNIFFNIFLYLCLLYIIPNINKIYKYD
jgi:hypothetical protein